MFTISIKGPRMGFHDPLVKIIDFSKKLSALILNFVCDYQWAERTWFLYEGRELYIFVKMWENLE